MAPAPLSLAVAALWPRPGETKGLGGHVGARGRGLGSCSYVKIGTRRAVRLATDAFPHPLFPNEACELSPHFAFPQAAGPKGEKRSFWAFNVRLLRPSSGLVRTASFSLTASLRYVVGSPHRRLIPRLRPLSGIGRRLACSQRENRGGFPSSPR